MSKYLAKIPEYRKGLIAILAAAVTLAQALGVPVAEGLSDQVVAVFDALAAAAVVVVPNVKAFSASANL